MLTHIHARITSQIKHFRNCHVRKVHKALDRSAQVAGRIELGLFGCISIFAFSFGSAGDLTRTDSLIYPLSQVSKLECRTQHRDTLAKECIIPLPIIEKANYAAYRGIKNYTDIYSTLAGGTYLDGRDHTQGGHPGVDIATSKGTPLASIADGEVVFAGWKNLYGNVVQIKHNFRGEIIYSVYAHMDSIAVKQGEKVKQGQRIGTVGNTGLVFGQLGGFHVNFEILKDLQGRPKPAFYGCPDSKQDRVKLVNEGTCRTWMLQNSYDPINLIERYRASTQPTQITVTTNKPKPAITQPTTVKPIVIPTKSTSSTTTNTTSSTAKPTETQPSVSKPANPTTPVRIQTITRAQIQNIGTIQNFFDTRELQIVSTIPNNTLIIGKKGTLTLVVMNKKVLSSTYQGFLPSALTVLTTNRNIQPSLSTIQYLGSEGITIDIAALRKGTSTLTFIYEGKTVAAIPIVVQ